MMRFLKLALFSIASLFCSIVLSSPNETGIVLLHGKQGTGDDPVIAGLSKAMLIKSTALNPRALTQA